MPIQMMLTIPPAQLSVKFVGNVLLVFYWKIRPMRPGSARMHIPGENPG